MKGEIKILSEYVPSVFITSIMLAVLVLSTVIVAEISCEDEHAARKQFENYYTWWYRLTHILVENKIYKLDEHDRRFVCAQIAKICFPTILKDVPLDEIEKQITEAPGDHQKYEYHTPKANGQIRWGRKRMFPCPKFAVSGGKIHSFFVSYGGAAHAALIFDRESTKKADVNVDRPPQDVQGFESYIKLAFYVTGLELNKPQKPPDNKDEKHDTQILS